MRPAGRPLPLILSAAGVLMDLMLLTHRPGPPLASYVEALWYYEGFQTAHHKERVLQMEDFRSSSVSPLVLERFPECGRGTS